MIKPEKNYLTIGDRKFFYVVLGNGEPVIFLPGWLALTDKMKFKKMFKESEDFLSKYKIYFLQLSNLYKSSYSEVPYTIDDYSDELKEAIHALGYRKVHLVGHSAGGRFALHFLHKYPNMVKKLVLMNAAGLKSPKKSESRLRNIKYFFAKFKAGKEKKKLLRETFINVYYSDLTETLKDIRIPTLIIWGEKDKEMKVRKAHKFHELIPNSELIIYPDLGHMTIRESKVFADIFKFIDKE